MKKILLFLIGLSVLMNIGLLLFIFNSTPIPSTSKQRVYPYLSKRIFAENTNDILINFTDLRQKMRSYTDSLQYRVGVYFEYLPSGTSIGVHEKETFIPASLIKVPIVIAIYKKIEMGQLRKNDFFTLDKKYIDSTSGDLWKKGPGARLALTDAIDMTLDDSDNTAKNVLLSRLNKKDLDFVFDSLDLDINSPSELSSQISPKNYSSVLRSLYLASYLNQDYSNEILELMTQSNDDFRIRAGIPDNIQVASKFGISYNPDPTKSVYSDCGIIYIPKRPYLLCIMIEAKEQEAYNVMKDYAKMTYDYVVSQ